MLSASSGITYFDIGAPRAGGYLSNFDLRTGSQAKTLLKTNCHLNQVCIRWLDEMEDFQSDVAHLPGARAARNPMDPLLHRGFCDGDGPAPATGELDPEISRSSPRQGIRHHPAVRAGWGSTRCGHVRTRLEGRHYPGPTNPRLYLTVTSGGGVRQCSVTPPLTGPVYQYVCCAGRGETTLGPKQLQHPHHLTISFCRLHSEIRPEAGGEALDGHGVRTYYARGCCDAGQSGRPTRRSDCWSTDMATPFTPRRAVHLFKLCGVARGKESADRLCVPACDALRGCYRAYASTTAGVP